MMEIKVIQYTLGLDQGATGSLNHLQHMLWKNVIFLKWNVMKTGKVESAQKSTWDKKRDLKTDNPIDQNI